jgi:hypothetical protein
MFAQKIPWQGLSDIALFNQVCKGARPSRSDCSGRSGVEMSDDAWNLMDSCWTGDASLRPDLSHVRDAIAMLKECHDMSSKSDISHSGYHGTSNSSVESSSKIDPVPILFAIHSPSSAVLSLPSGRIPSLRHRHQPPNNELAHPDRAMSCENLARSLKTRYQRTGDSDLLGEVIDLEREALELRPPGHSDRATSCENLARSLETRYQRTGDVGLLGEAIDLEREVLELRPPGHPGRATSCQNLARSLNTYYQRTGAVRILDEAINLEREALELRPARCYYIWR